MSRAIATIVLLTVIMPARQVDVGFASLIAQSNPSMELKEQELLANALVESVLPELRPVLKSLKRGSKKEYGRAVGDLARAAKRLETFKDKDSVAYELEVGVLQTQTRADIALAELQLKKTEAAQKKYRDALLKREAARVARAAHEAQRMQERLSRMQSQLDRLISQANPDEIEARVNKAFASAMRRIKPKSGARTSQDKEVSKSEKSSKQ